MSDHLIVFNERSGRYRIERRSPWGWSVVMENQGREYLTFDDYDATRRYLCRGLDVRTDSHRRRWHEFDPYRCSHPAD